MEGERKIDSKLKFKYRTLEKYDLINTINKYKKELVSTYRQFIDILVSNERTTEIYNLEDDLNEESKTVGSDGVKEIYTEISQENKQTIKRLKEKLAKLENTKYEFINSTIFKLDEINIENWIVNQVNNIIITNHNSISVINKKNEEIFLVYLDKNQSLEVNTKHFSENIDEVSDYTVFFEGQCSGELKATVGVIKYYSDGIVDTEFINLNESLVIEKDSLVKLSFVLKFISSGEFRLDRIEVEKNSKFYVSSVSEKYTKVQKFLQDLNEQSNENYEKKINYSINTMAILDEFSRECLKPEVNLINISYDNWENEIIGKEPKLLFVESAWNGINNSWKNKLARIDDKISTNLEEIIEYCNRNSIPTVFWNKEGAINFDYFKNTSSLFDYIFVTDENIIERQKEVCNHDRVYILPFAAQPKIHNPINKNKNKLGQVAFAGTWYGYKYPSRIKDMNTVLEPALKYDVDIYDRIFNFNVENVDECLKWPDKYSSNIVGQLPYKAITEAYKNYDVFLNVNSIKNSKFMMARRVYEILACKTPVISSYSEAIEYELKGYVNSCKTKEDAQVFLRQLLSSRYLLEKQGKVGQRYILEKHTYSKRMEKVFDIVGLKYEKKVNKKVAIIGTINNIDGLSNFLDNIVRQTYTCLEVILIINSREIDINDIKLKFSNVKQLSLISGVGISITELASAIISKSTGEYFMFFNEGAYYGDNYIKDCVNSYSYIDVEIIGKSNYYRYIKDEKIIIKILGEFGEECYCNKLYQGTLVITKNMFKHISSKCTEGDIIEEVILATAKSQGIKMYSSDCSNFCAESMKLESDMNYNIVFFTEDYKTFINI